MKTAPFNDAVIGRMRTCRFILGDPKALAEYEAAGGTKRELEIIVEEGLKAQAMNTSQRGLRTGNQASTVEVLKAFADLRERYGKVLIVLRAVRQDLVDAKAAPALVKKAEGVIANDTFVAMTPTKGDAAKRSAKKRRSMEAVREEIQTDLQLLVEATELHPWLEARKVTQALLSELLDLAKEFAGKLDGRLETRAARQEATRAEYAAVNRQSELWNCCWRILDEVAQRNAELASHMNRTEKRMHA